MSHVSKVATPMVALVFSVAILTLSVTALASPTTTTTLSQQTLSAGNAYADALLARQPLPPGAHLVSTLTPSPGPPTAAFAKGGAIRSADREYEVPLSDSVDKYVSSHIPVGETLNGEGTSGGPNIRTTHTLELAASCPSPHVTYCGVSYDYVEADGHQDLRVDVQVVWLPIVRVTMPTSGLVSVTGFATTSLVHGSGGKSTVVLSTSQAHQLAREISGLKDMSQSAQCMEDSALLSINVSQNGKVVWNAIADECPGELRISGGQLLDDRSCSFWHVVNAFFPAGTAAATKTDSAAVCSDTNNG